MKRIALFSALVALLCWQSRSVLAQEVYHTFLEEGKVWTYLHYNDRTGKRYQFTRVIDGDTVIGGLTYKKILDKVGGQYQYALREEGKKVYIVDGHYETESLLYDFNKDVGDYLFLKETGAGDGTMQGWTILQGSNGDSPNNWTHISDFDFEYSTGHGHNSSNGYVLSESYLIEGEESVHPDNYLVSPRIAWRQHQLLGD